MNRKMITKLLTDTLIRDKLSDRKYYAKEVTLDYGSSHPKRIDVVQFIPAGVLHASDIEKGIFVCYEIKSCIEDVYSGHGLRFYGEKNYIVTTMETYKQLCEDQNSGKFSSYLKENYPESSTYYGIMVLIPEGRKPYDEFENPTPVTEEGNWKLWTAIPCRQGPRTRSITEMLFCMLRAKGNNGIDVSSNL